MNDHAPLSTSRDKLLFTPGPLTTSLTVKQAMVHDAGSWHFEFNSIVKRIRESLLKIANLTAEDAFDAILMQGSGTFGVESVIASVVPPEGRLLILANGAYGERMAKIATYQKIDHRVLHSRKTLCRLPRTWKTYYWKTLRSRTWPWSTARQPQAF